MGLAQYHDTAILAMLLYSDGDREGFGAALCVFHAPVVTRCADTGFYYAIKRYVD